MPLCWILRFPMILRMLENDSRLRIIKQGQWGHIVDPCHFLREMSKTETKGKVGEFD